MQTTVAFRNAVRVLDLFSGIGGFSLGLERAGMRTVAFCEIDPFCRAVLKKHWPSVPCFADVRSLQGADIGRPEVICGGFPCQDISFAGKGAGINGARSGLWGEYARLIGELRPSYAIVENVAALLVRGLDRVLGDLAALGYDTEWYCIPASAVGAPHRRDRIWIVAYPGRERGSVRREAGDVAGQAGEGESEGHQRERDGNASDDCRATVADAHEPRLERRLRESLRECAGERAAWTGGASDTDAAAMQRTAELWSEPNGDHAGLADVADASGEQFNRRWRGSESTGRSESSDRGWWFVEPDVGRVADGVPARVDRLRSLGNAVVPQIPEIIGRAIMSYEASR